MPFKNRHPLYQTWNGIKQRCYNKNNTAYHRYGGRGIIMCNEWVSDFYRFASDMGEKPTSEHTIDRIENDGWYSPENCRWATRAEQAFNRSDAVHVEIQGVKYRAIELAKIAGVKTDTIIERANRCLSYEEVISADKLHNLSGLSIGAKASSIARKARTHCKRGHEYTDRNTLMQKSGRSCKKCHALRERMRKKGL